MAFENRTRAGTLLAGRLSAHRGSNPLVLAIPRGGVPLGRAIADHLGGELDVVLVQKLRSPDNREFAIGSVAEDGHVYLSAEAWTLRVGEAYLRGETAAQFEALKRRRAAYSPVRPPADPAGRVAIVVDDGIVTGATMISALRIVRRRRPSRLVAAVPVASPETLKLVASWTDEIVCLETPETVDVLAPHYRDFSPITEGEAVELLRAVPTLPSSEA